jgi:Inovirus Coat protein B
MKTAMTQNVTRGLVAFVVMTLVGGANAAAVDVSSVVTDIGAQAAPVGLIGVAVLLIYGAVKAFKWVRSALS